MSDVLAALPAVVAGVLSAAAVHLLGRYRPHLLRRPNKAAVWAVVAVSAVLASTASVSPTGIDGVDTAYRAVFAAAVTWCAGRARRGPRVVSGAIAAVGSAGAWPWNAVAFSALGMATGSASIRRPGRPLGVVVGALQAQVLLRLAWPDTSYVTAALAAAAALVLASSGIRNARRHERRRAALILGAVSLSALLAVVLGGIGLFRVQDDVVDGARSARSGLSAVGRGDVDLAAAELARAQSALRAAGDGFDGALVGASRLLPVVGRYVEAGERVTKAAADVIDPALESARLADDGALRVRNATVDLDALARLTPPLERTLDALPDARQALLSLAEEPLPDQAREEIDELRQELDDAAADGAVALETLELAPGLLGADAPRRYFVAMQSPSEQRANGGLLGGYGILVADRGRLDLVEAHTISNLLGAVEGRRGAALPPEYDRFGPTGPEESLQNVTNVPDFPTVARTLADLYPRSGGEALDGVLSVDPFVLASLLSLTGPVQVEQWPEPITADNAVRVLLYEQYLRLDGADDNEFIVDTTEAAFDRLQTASLPAPARIATELSPHLQSNRLQLFSTRPAEQALFERTGAAGAMPNVDGDFLQLVTMNNSANKIDWFQSRAISYDVTHDPATGKVDAIATIAITNGAPAEGESALLIGGLRDVPGPLGRSRLTIDVYSALELEAATVDGQPLAMAEEGAFGRNLYWTVELLGPGQTLVLELHLTGLVPPGAPYVLDVGMQPVIRPGDMTVRVGTAEPWEITGAAGLERDGEVASTRFPLTEPRRFVVRSER